MKNVIFILSVVAISSVSGCAQQRRQLTEICNEKKLCSNDTLFRYEQFNPLPIRHYERFNSPFHIEMGHISGVDSTFKLNNESLYKILLNNALLPNTTDGNLVEYSVETMNSFTFYSNSGVMDTGICCLDVVSLYMFSFEENIYVALYCLEYGTNYFPSENIYDEILLLYRIEGKSLKILISLRQGDLEFQAFGDFNQNGRLDFIRATNETEPIFIYSYEMNSKGDQFERTNKYLNCYYEDNGTRIVDCSKSCWY